MTYDHYFLNFCYQLASQQDGNTSPNPAVAAIVASGDRVISYGAHLKAGTPHAETIALDRAGMRANGATLYCSLEPCAHFGKTPPCVHKIVESGIRRVVFGAMDQNPEVSGKGRHFLQEKGLEVVHIPVPWIERFYSPFFRTFDSSRPYVIAKAAITANGMIAASTGTSKWITNETSRRWVHHLRATCDAILTGANTVRLDQPALTVRDTGFSRQPLRVVIDPSFRLHPEKCSLLHQEGPILIFGRSDSSAEAEISWKGYPVQVMRYEQPADLLRSLLILGRRKVLIEAGQSAFTLFHSHNLIDEYVIMIAPRLLMGKNSLNLLAGSDQALGDSPRLLIKEVLELNGDVIIRMTRT